MGDDPKVAKVTIEQVSLKCDSLHTTLRHFVTRRDDICKFGKQDSGSFSPRPRAWDGPDKADGRQREVRELGVWLEAAAQHLQRLELPVPTTEGHGDVDLDSILQCLYWELADVQAAAASISSMQVLRFMLHASEMQGRLMACRQELCNLIQHLLHLLGPADLDDLRADLGNIRQRLWQLQFLSLQQDLEHASQLRTIFMHMNAVEVRRSSMEGLVLQVLILRARTDTPVPSLLEAQLPDLEAEAAALRTASHPKTLPFVRELVIVVEKLLQKLPPASAQNGSAAAAVPPVLRDPITRALMREPVLLVDTGETYDKRSLDAWFASGQQTCPISNKKLRVNEYVPNLAVAKLISEHAEPSASSAAGEGEDEFQAALSMMSSSMWMSATMLPVADSDAVSDDSAGDEQLYRTALDYEMPQPDNAPAAEIGCEDQPQHQKEARPEVLPERQPSLPQPRLRRQLSPQVARARGPPSLAEQAVSRAQASLSTSQQSVRVVPEEGAADGGSSSDGCGSPVAAAAAAVYEAMAPSQLEAMRAFSARSGRRRRPPPPPPPVPPVSEPVPAEALAGTRWHVQQRSPGPDARPRAATPVPLVRRGSSGEQEGLTSHPSDGSVPMHRAHSGGGSGTAAVRQPPPPPPPAVAQPAAIGQWLVLLGLGQAWGNPHHVAEYLVDGRGGSDWGVRRLAGFQGHTATVLTGSWDQTIAMWDMRGRQPVRWSVQELPGRVLCVDVMRMRMDSPQGAARDPYGVLAGCEDGTTAVVLLHRPFPLLHKMQEHSGSVRGVAGVGDGARFVSAAEDRTLKLWHLGRPASLCTMAGHTQPATCCRCWEAARVAVSSGADAVVRLWDLRVGKSMGTLRGHRSGVKDLSIDPLQGWIASASNDRSVRVWDARSPKSTLVATANHGSRVYCVKWGGDGRTLFFGARDRQLVVKDIRMPDQVLAAARAKGPVYSCDAVEASAHFVPGTADD